MLWPNLDTKLQNNFKICFNQIIQINCPSLGTGIDALRKEGEVVGRYRITNWPCTWPGLLGLINIG